MESLFPFFSNDVPFVMNIHLLDEQYNWEVGEAPREMCQIYLPLKNSLFFHWYWLYCFELFRDRLISTWLAACPTNAWLVQMGHCYIGKWTSFRMIPDSILIIQWQQRYEWPNFCDQFIFTQNNIYIFYFLFYFDSTIHTKWSSVFSVLQEARNLDCQTIWRVCLIH